MEKASKRKDVLFFLFLLCKNKSRKIDRTQGGDRWIHGLKEKNLSVTSLKIARGQKKTQESSAGITSAGKTTLCIHSVYIISDALGLINTFSEKLSKHYKVTAWQKQKWLKEKKQTQNASFSLSLSLSLAHAHTQTSHKESSCKSPLVPPPINLLLEKNYPHTHILVLSG